MGLRANTALYSIKGIDINSVDRVSSEILSSAKKQEPQVVSIDYSKFNRANLGVDLYSPRTTPELQKQIALTQKGLYIEAINVQKLNSNAALNLYRGQKNVELLQSIDQFELAAPKKIEKNKDVINLFNIEDKNPNSKNGYNPFSTKQTTDEKEGKSN